MHSVALTSKYLERNIQISKYSYPSINSNTKRLIMLFHLRQAF